MLSQLMVLFGFFALVLVSVYWVNRAVSLFDSLIADGQSAQIFLEFTALTLPNVMRLVLPVACFAAAVYAVNRMVTESEFVIMQATGLSPWRLARPVAVFGLIVALLVAGLLHYLVPLSRAQLLDRRGEIAENITARLLSEGRFLHPSAGITLYIRNITQRGALEDILLVDTRRGDGTETTYTASEALLVRGDSGPQLLMIDGLAQGLHGPGQRLSVTAFDSLSYDLAELIGQGAARPPGLREMSSWHIAGLDDAGLASARTTAAEARLEIHTRMAQPLMAPAAALIGFAALILGAFSRMGIPRQVLGAVVLVICMQLLHTAITGTVAETAALAPLVYLPPLAGFVAAGALLWLSTRPRRGRVSGLGAPWSLAAGLWRRAPAGGDAPHAATALARGEDAPR